jgi:hypothetical protein
MLSAPAENVTMTKQVSSFISDAVMQGAHRFELVLEPVTRQHG